ncbi:MAG: VacJ family lipoprotein [Methylococcaceae bacterium]|nr:VacJ family lipoprotein [Methylococcaceae bacterium]
MHTFPHNKGVSTLFITLLILLTLFLAGCASTEVIEEDIAEVDVATETDPFEDFNRSMFGFNESLDTYLAEPISDAYLWVTPQFVQTGIANFFNNLKDVNVVLNDMMQGKLMQGVGDTGRFTVNSTIGLLGLFDVATEIGLEKHEEDFAQTLAVWGVPAGPYLVLPILGPSTSRGVPGAVFDTAANPASYIGLPIQVLQMLNARANAEGGLNFINEAALDPYVFTRESFLQYRKHLITDGESEITDDLLDLEDEFYDEDELSDEFETLDTNELPAEVSPVTIKGIDEQVVEKTGFQLELSSETKDFEQASDSLDGAVQSLDEATTSFEEAGDKIIQMENQ